MFKMQDEQGVDDKIICVPLRDPNWNVHDRLEDLPELLRAEIEQFFSIYKDLEDKHVRVDGWRSREDAVQEIHAARQRFAEARRAGKITEHPGPGGRLPGPQRRQ